METETTRPLSNFGRLSIRLTISIVGGLFLVFLYRAAIGDLPKENPDMAWMNHIAELPPSRPVTIEDCRIPFFGNQFGPGCAEVFRQMERDRATKN
jgi:hypothetical protein